MESGQTVQMGPLSRAILDRGGAPLAERDPLVRYGLVPSPAGARAATPATTFSVRSAVRHPVVLITAACMVAAWLIGVQVASNNPPKSPSVERSQTARSATQQVNDQDIGATDGGSRTHRQQTQFDELVDLPPPRKKASDGGKRPSPTEKSSSMTRASSKARNANQQTARGNSAQAQAPAMRPKVSAAPKNLAAPPAVSSRPQDNAPETQGELLPLRGG